MDVTERFQAKVIADPVTGCQKWSGGRTPDGYGKFYHQGRVTLAHRWAWEQAHGAVPDGLELDHLCRNRACCNPDHLEPVTRRTNTLRGIGPSAQNARKTHCPRGHAYAGANLYTHPTMVGRRCRECARQSAAAYRDRRRKAS